MPANPPENMPRITPYLYYKDVASALEWLARALRISKTSGVRSTGTGKTHDRNVAVGVLC